MSIPGLLIARQFQGTQDSEAMSRLARAYPHANTHVTDLPYRLASWAFDTPANTSIWETAEGQIVAWAVWQQPFITLDYAYDPELGADMENAILAWGINRFQEMAVEHGRVLDYYIDVQEGDTDRKALLQACGFTYDEWDLLHMTRDLTDPIPATDLPEGYSIRPINGASELEAYVKLHRAAFGSENMTTEWRARIMQAPEYKPDIDLVAVAPDGTLAGFCILWLNPTQRGQHNTAEGQIEPLGIHPGFQGKGLGRALLNEGLRRLSDLGAKIAIVQVYNDNEGANHVYEAVGFRTHHKILKYAQSF